MDICTDDGMAMGGAVCGMLGWSTAAGIGRASEAAPPPTPAVGDMQAARSRGEGAAIESPLPLARFTRLAARGRARTSRAAATTGPQERAPIAAMPSDSGASDAESESTGETGRDGRLEDPLPPAPLRLLSLRR